MGHAEQPHRRRLLRPGRRGFPVLGDREQCQRGVPPQPRQPRLAGATLDAAAAVYQARSGTVDIQSSRCRQAAQPLHGAMAQPLVMCSAMQNGGDEEGKRHNGNALPRMRRLQRSGSISFTQRQVGLPPDGLLQAPCLQRRAVCLGPTRQFRKAPEASVLVGCRLSLGS